MTDFATLGIKIDSTQAKQAAGDLDRLTAAGGRAEAATIALGRGSKGAGFEAAAMAAAAQASASGINAQALSFKTATAEAKLNTLAMRETLVVAREISRGNFTRLPGSLTLLAQGISSQGSGLSGYATQLLKTLGIIQTVQNAELAEAAASAAASAAGVRAAAVRAGANITAADTEVALAQAAVRTAETSTAAAAAQARLAAAHEAVAAAAAEATIAENALAAAQGRVAETGAASAAATRTIIGGTGVGLIGIATVAGVAYGAFKQFQDQVRGSGELDRYAESLRLTDEQIKKAGGSIKYLSDHTREITGLTVTFGDVMHGVFEEIGKEANSGGAWDSFKGHASDAFSGILDVWNKTSAALSAGLWTIGDIAKDVFQYVAQKIGQGFYDGVNSAIDALNQLNAKIPKWAGGGDPNLIPHLKPDKAVGDLKSLGATIQSQANKNYAAALAANKAAYSGIEKSAIDHNKRMLQIESDGNKPPKGKKAPGGDHGLAEALAELDAQIKGQNALAAAYQVSDAAAIKAEAMQKAEEAAIRHKGEVGVFYEKELALAVATRAADGAKTIADIHAEAAARSVVNDLVEQGIIPVQRMGQALQEQTKKRQLMAALAVAEDKGWLKQAADLSAEIANLAFSQGVLNEQLAKEAALRQVAINKDQLAQIQLETELIGADNVVRAKRLALLQAQNFIRDNGIKDPTRQADVTKSYVDAAVAAANLTTANDNYNASLTYTADLMSLLNDRAGTLGSTLSDAFGNMGNSIGSAISALSGYEAAQAKIEQDRKAAVKVAGNDASALAKVETLYATKSANARMAATGQVLHSLKGLFKEHSVGYQVMTAIEKGYAIFQAIETVASIVRDTTKTASSVANSAIRTTANTAEGGSKIFAELGPFAFPVVAAMVAVLAALGAKALGGGGGAAAVAPPSSQSLQDVAGTGTVLGSPKDKSASIAHSLELVAANTNTDLQYSNQMLIALRSIDVSIGAMAASVAKQINVNGSLFDTSGLRLGSSGSAGFLGLFSSSTTRSLFDAGITLAATTVGNIVASGIAGSTYQIVEQIHHSSGFLGIGGGTSTTYQTTTGALPSDITASIQSVIAALENGLVTAANEIGIQGAKAMLDGFTVNIGKISFNGLDAQGIEDQLNAIFSSVGDQMAQKLFPALASMQKVGEGLFETFSRVAKEYEAVDIELKSIGRTFGAVGVSSISARDALVQLFGGLDEFVTATDSFRDKFLTAAEQTAPIQASVIAEMQRLGLAGITTREQFKNVVLGLDLTTDAGRQMYASLLAVAPAFDKVLSYFDEANKTAIDGLQSTADQFKSFADSLQKYRDTLFNTGATQAATTSLLQQRFAVTAALAASGNATGLGNLQNDAKAYLDSAQLSAHSQLEYQRAVAQVAAGVDRGIFAATETADYAQLQLEALKNATSILQQISDNTAAMVQTVPVIVQAPLAAPAPAPAGTDAPATAGDIQALQTDINAGLVAIATNTQTTAKILKLITPDGYLNVGSDPLTPVYTTAAP